MSLKTKQIIIALLGVTFLVSLIFVQWMEVARKREELGLVVHLAFSKTELDRCANCHKQQTPGIYSHWHDSTHAAKGIGCVDCHQAKTGEADAFDHEGYTIATVVTPLDCKRCHEREYEEFSRSHHAAAGNILASLDNFLAETVEGSRVPFSPHSPTPGRNVNLVNGMASAATGCLQCHGSKVALQGIDGPITVDDLDPDPKTGMPRNTAILAKIIKNKSKDNKPIYDPATWPNTGIGRLNLDGSRGSCSACHSRHDFSPRRARQPENCGKCHLGPDHPQKEIYEESKHGIAYRDLKDKMKLDGDTWILGQDYAQAPTCATCHMSAHSKSITPENPSGITHDPGQRISWTNRPPVSRVMDTDKHGNVVQETDPAKRAELVVEGWSVKRDRMKLVCLHCHTSDYVNNFYKQYDDFIINYNEKFAKPGGKIMAALLAENIRTKANFDEEIEWTWFYLWHHEGRRARHGASMMAPDYAHWHGMYEVAERFYMKLIPQARHMAEEAKASGNIEGAEAVLRLIDELLARPEHAWFEAAKKGGVDDAAKKKAR